ncbi:hypothetical protein LTR56_025130 [Elasticomyces elasticus]|nr:hypothetical protein LTR56_025130 [Elasticomyces elasticus]KAK3621312.1 hypothetical protein LTR22_025247 [Elasticomyces elasticus]KAK4904861.1 hypothetical protein LTR49_025752 [Elasticomyces elasticus]KAK5741015.1 hypothetical protein LTS12_024735 [Elasticomyces elasticus]
MARINDTLAVIATSVGKAQPPTLLTIAPELRNTIYEFVFAVDAGPVKLLEASPPEKALLQVCKQTLNEAAGLYVAAFRSYWQGTTFTIHRTPEIFTSACHVNFNMQDIVQINTLLSITNGNSHGDNLEVLQRGLSRLSISARADSVCTFRHSHNMTWLFMTVDGSPVDTGNGVLVELRYQHGSSYYYPSRATEVDDFPAERQLTLQQLQVILGRKLLLKHEEAMADEESEV